MSGRLVHVLQIATASMLCLLLPPTQATAEVFATFAGDALDASMWTRRGDTTHFTASDGRLRFPCVAAAQETLVARKPAPQGFYELTFADYRSSNASPSGRGLGSYLALGLAADDVRVRMIRGNISRGGYFEGNHFHNGTYDLWYHDTSAASGKLGILHDGAGIKFYYQAALSEGVPWRRVGPAVTPDWKSDPKLFIAGSAGSSGCTEFSVTNVSHIPLPLPKALQAELE